MKKIFYMLLVGVVMVSTAMQVQAQMDKPNNSVRIGWSYMPLAPTDPQQYGLSNRVIYGNGSHAATVEYTHRIGELFSVGAYAGVGGYTYIKYPDETPSISNPYDYAKDAVMVRFGVSGQVQLLPLMGVETTCLDVYAAGRLGSVRLYYNWIEYGAGVGATLNITRNIGLYGSCMWGRYWAALEDANVYRANLNTQLGLQFSF